MNRLHLNESFATIADMARALQRYEASGGADFDRRLVLQATPTGLHSATPTEGGFLVDTQHTLDIWEKADEVGELLRRTTRIPITTRSNRLRLPCVNETSRANGSRAGGLALAWLDEAEEFPQSDLRFGEMNLIAKLLGGTCFTTNELLADSPAFNSWFPRAAGKELAFCVEDAIVNGSGAGRPLGILNSDSLITVQPESGQAPATVRSENISKMASRLFSGCWNSPGVVWLCNTDVFAQLENQRAANGAPLVQYSLGQRHMIGWPLLTCEFTSQLGALGDIILCDLREYIVSEREAGILGSIHLRFLQDETALKIKTRVDAQPGWSSPITPKSGSQTQSAFVTLAAR